MKTTLDLPDDLVKEVKLRALQEGLKLKDAIADLLRKGLSSQVHEETVPKSRFSLDKRTGLPTIVGAKQPKQATLTPERVAEILLEQEVDRNRQAS